MFEPSTAQNNRLSERQGFQLSVKLIYQFSYFSQTPEEAFDKIMDVNVKAAFMLVKECVPYMEKRGWTML